VRERERYTLAERLAIGWGAAAAGFWRDFAGLFIVVPIYLIAYAFGMPTWAGEVAGVLPAYFGSAPLSRWLLTQVRLHRTNRGGRFSVPDVCPSPDGWTVKSGDSREIDSVAAD
jgi:hypothetical protein